MQPWWSLYLLAVFMLGLDSKLAGQAFQPEFVEPITNLTVPIGRNATFRCLVQNLGGYRVGWVKADTKAIQAIHVHVITNNHRVGVSHNGQTVWNLHIRNVQEEDRGQYMCQINTDPMKSQVRNLVFHCLKICDIHCRPQGHFYKSDSESTGISQEETAVEKKAERNLTMGFLDVVIPPDFIPEETSSDVMVPEGGTVRVSCRARGIPTPMVVWRREDGTDIVLRDQFGGKNRVNMFKEEVLTLSKVSRSDMGAYLCIASNGVPPTVSKRILIKVHFHPVIQVPNQLVGAPLGTDVTLECYVESSPKSINYWVRDSNEMVISSNKYEVVNTALSSFESRMALTVRRLTAADVGGYRCVAKNSLGEVDSVIRLYEIPGPTVRNTSPVTRKEEFSTPMEGPDDQFGSADRSDDEEDKETYYVTDKAQNMKNVLENTTKNRSFVFTPSNTVKQKLSNKVSKILNQLEMEDSDFQINKSCYLNPIFVIVYSSISVVFRINIY